MKSNLHFHGLLLFKAYKDIDKKVQKSYVSWYWRVMQSSKENWLLVTKVTGGIWWILMWAVTNLKVCTLTWYFCQEHVKFQLKKYRKIISHDTEDWSKLWRKTFCLRNYMRNLVNFNASSGKSENLHFNRLLFRKVCNAWAKQIQRSCFVKMTLV